MGRRLTQEEFIKKAREVHGDTYDYSKVVYKNTDTKVIIVCPIHGEFLQQPRTHMAGQKCPKCAHLQRAETCMKRYGVSHPMTTKKSREKAKKIVQEKYGVDNVFQLESVKEKSRATCLERYGVEHVTQSLDIQEQIRETNLQRYGVSCSMQNEDVKSRHRASVKAHYGVENSMQVSEVRAKAIATCMDRYGVDNPRKSPDIDAKIRETCMERYGVPYVVQADVVREKTRETWLDKYGVENPWMAAEVRQKIAETCLRKYGYENVLAIPEIQQRRKDACMAQYGVYYPMQSEEIRQRIYETKKQNHTFNTSNPEEMLYDLLVVQFGKHDVLRQYSSDEYSFSCDFYIQSRNMYIELNAHWSHGGHWFGTRNEDNNCLSVWEEKSVESVYYQNAIQVWTERDVLKRSIAEKNKLNYVVFWDCDLRDVEMWFALDCPDGQDWRKEYSWLET